MYILAHQTSHLKLSPHEVFVNTDTHALLLSLMVLLEKPSVEPPVISWQDR